MMTGQLHAITHLPSESFWVLTPTLKNSCQTEENNCLCIKLDRSIAYSYHGNCVVKRRMQQRQDETSEAFQADDLS